MRSLFAFWLGGACVIVASAAQINDGNPFFCHVGRTMAEGKPPA